MLTTNSIELLWNVLKNYWLCGRRVVDYVSVLYALVGKPGGATQGQVGAKIKLVLQRIAGVVGLAHKGAVMSTANAVALFADAITVGDVVVTVVGASDSGLYKVTSKSIALVYPQPVIAHHSSASHRVSDFISTPFYHDSARTPTGIENTILLARQSSAEVRGRVQLSASMLALTVTGKLTGLVKENSKDPYGYEAQLLALPRTLSELFAAELSLVHNLAEKFRKIQLLRRQPLIDGSRALRQGVGRGFLSSPLSLADEALSLAALVCIGPVNARTLSPALQRQLELNIATTVALETEGAAPLVKGDFKGTAAPAVGLVYVAAAKVPAAVLVLLCEWHLTKGYSISRMDGKPAPEGLRLMLIEVEHLARALVELNRGEETISVFYPGSECRGEGQDRFLRYWDHFCGGASGSESGPGNDIASQILRFTSRREQGRALTPITKVPLANGDRQVVVSIFRRIVAFCPLVTRITHGTEAFVSALLFPLFNNSPPGEATRYYTSYGGIPSRAEFDLNETITDAGGAASATKVGIATVKNTIVSRRLASAERVLMAGATSVSVAKPTLSNGRYSLYQLVCALRDAEDAAPRVPFYVNVCSNHCTLCRSLRRHGARPCKHVITCRGLYADEQLQRGILGIRIRQPWYARDTSAFLKGYCIDPPPLFISTDTSTRVLEPGAQVISPSGVSTLLYNAAALITLLPTLIPAVAQSLSDRGVIDTTIHDSIARVCTALSQASLLLHESEFEPVLPAGLVYDHSALETVSKSMHSATRSMRESLGMAAVAVFKMHGGGVPGPRDAAARSASDLVGRREDPIRRSFFDRRSGTSAAVNDADIAYSGGSAAGVDAVPEVMAGLVGHLTTGEAEVEVDLSCSAAAGNIYENVENIEGIVGGENIGILTKKRRAPGASVHFADTAGSCTDAVTDSKFVEDGGSSVPTDTKRKRQ